MSIIAENNERVAAAQRRILARQTKMRSDVLVLKHSWGAMLTQPWVVGGAFVGGLIFSRRSHSAQPPVECKCKSPAPSLLRSVGTALLVPMINRWMDAAPKRPSAASAQAGPTQGAPTLESSARQ